MFPSVPKISAGSSCAATSFPTCSRKSGIPSAGLIQIGLPRWANLDFQSLDKDFLFSMVLLLHSKVGVDVLNFRSANSWPNGSRAVCFCFPILQLPAQPGFREGPAPLDGGFGSIKGQGDLRHRQATE